MVRLTDLFDHGLLKQMLIERYVRIQSHPSLPLNIINYTELAQFQRQWNEVTLQCRGLIYNVETEEVIARGFRKFFNWDDSSQPYPPSGPVLRSPKMDGSLGILYKTGEHSFDWAVATRGSFASDQAVWATERLQKMNDTEETWLEGLNPAKSYLAEIIFPANRIVVDYLGAERLVLLDVLDTATGKSDLDEFERVYWLDKVERVYIPGGFSDSFGQDIPEGEEGFVIYWPGRDYRVKMKSASYLELHRMIFSLSERAVWQRLGDGETAEDICVKLPDEFHGWVREVGERLFEQQADIMHRVEKEYNALIEEQRNSSLPTAGRKEFAAKAAKSPNRAYLFMMYDGKDISKTVWKTLKPEGGKTVTTISEDVA